MIRAQSDLYDSPVLTLLRFYLAFKYCDLKVIIVYIEYRTHNNIFDTFDRHYMQYYLAIGRTFVRHGQRN